MNCFVRTPSNGRSLNFVDAQFHVLESGVRMGARQVEIEVGRDLPPHGVELVFADWQRRE